MLTVKTISVIDFQVHCLVRETMHKAPWCNVNTLTIVIMTEFEVEAHVQAW